MWPPGWRIRTRMAYSYSHGDRDCSSSVKGNSKRSHRSIARALLTELIININSYVSMSMPLKIYILYIEYASATVSMTWRWQCVCASEAKIVDFRLARVQTYCHCNICPATLSLSLYMHTKYDTDERKALRFADNEWHTGEHRRRHRRRGCRCKHRMCYTWWDLSIWALEWRQI